MISLVAALILLLTTYPIDGGLVKVSLLLLAQALLVVPFLRERTVSMLGAFAFMSFVFFGLRPLYILVENDTDLLIGLFRISPSPQMLADAMWWVTAATAAFVIGGFGLRHFMAKTDIRPQLEMLPLLSSRFCGVLLAYQIVSILFMVLLHGRISYGSDAGAYLYDFPVVLQGGQIFAVVGLAERALRRQTLADWSSASLSLILFLAFTVLLRSTTLFRGQWLTGVMILAIVSGIRIRGRFPLAYLVFIVLALLPVFRVLGELRGSDASDVAVELARRRPVAAEDMWNFLDSDGDINIFDGFVAAKESRPAFYPYLWSWLYVPLHWIPRKFWPGKPESGIMEDTAYANGAPFSPGVAGFFLLDGGLLWMLGCMAALGSVFAIVEYVVRFRTEGYFHICCYAAVVVNALFLPRFLLWQAFYQTLYFLIPCYVLYRLSRVRVGRQEAMVTDQPRFGPQAANRLRPYHRKPTWRH